MSSWDAMSKRRRSNGRQDHPSGPVKTVDDGLRKRILTALQKKRWTQKDLAPKILKPSGEHISEGAISNVLTGKTTQIRYLDQLLEVLELEDYEEVLRKAMSKADADTQALIVGLAKKATGLP